MIRKIAFVLFCSIYSICITAQGNKPLDLKEIIAGKFRSEGVRGVAPMADGEHYTQINKEGTQIIKYSFKTGEPVATLFDVATAREVNFKKIDGYLFSPDETNILISTETIAKYRHSYRATHYLFNIKNNKVEPLSDNGPQEVPVFSPDGTMIAFVRDNNIYLVKLLFGNSESQVTEDGKFNQIINGAPDWVYEEEFGFNRALEFSEDSQMLAFIRFDESEVREFSLQLYAGETPRIDEFDTYPGQYSYKYPKAGEANSKVSVHTFDIKSRVTRKMNLPLDEDGYIPRIRFTKDPNKLAIMTMNRHQNRFDLYFGDPRSTVCKLVVRDESPYYIDTGVLDNIVFYPTGFSFLSEKDGFAHLYWYNMNGTMVQQVTKGNFEVKRFLGMNEKTNIFYYESNEGSALRSAIYKIDKKGKKTNLTEQAGTNTALFSKDMNYFINTYSNSKTPPVITIRDNNGKVLKTMVSNDQLKQTIAEYDYPTPEFFTFKTSQGTSLNGFMIKPTHFSASTKYPVLMYQYSGPGSQQVTDRWGIGGGGGWELYMANQGYIIVCVDGRGTGGRGAEFAKCTYLNLGVKEAQDQVEAAKYMANQPYVDGARIGIWGWSYGGYMTLMSMSEGTPVFKAGAAVAAVTNWKYYDTIYAERYMRTPKENMEGYKAGSAFSRAYNLNGRVLLIHGMADDNVHFQNCVEYMEQLVQLGKQFDMQIYTNRNHGIYGGNTRLHLFTRLTDFFKTNL